MRAYIHLGLTERKVTLQKDENINNAPIKNNVENYSEAMKSKVFLVT